MIARGPAAATRVRNPSSTLKSAAAVADPTPMRRTHSGGQQGFTLVEVMMAALVLVVGILGVVTLVDRANGAIGESNARVGATNLARELVEYTRAADYDDVTNGRLPALLHAKTGVSGTGNPWVVVRRNVKYTVTIKSCLFDDPADGLVPTTFTTGDADRPLCTRAAAINTKVDSNPDDFRRLQVDIDWTYRGAKKQHATQDALIVNPSGGLGPRITSFPAPAGQITAASAPSGHLTFTGVSPTVSLTTTPAKAVRWNVSEAAGGDAVAVGSASLATDWRITWELGVDTDPSYVYDGSYTISAQAFTDLGVPGNLWANPVLINRYLPQKPSGFVAGRNPFQGPKVVELRWSRNPEGDIIGYRVRRIELDGSKTPICPSTATAVTAPDATSCLDTNAPASLAVTYELVAVDRTVIANSGSAPRESSTAAQAIALVAVPAPDTPTGLTVQTDADRPLLKWTQPGVAPVSFYRIYRDGTAIAARYATTVTSATFWADPDPGPSPNPGHSYRVSAVGPTLSESSLSAEVLWP